MLLVLNGKEVRQALPMSDAIEGMKIAFGQLSAGETAVPLRSHLDIPQKNGVALVMPAFLPESGALTVKVVSVFPENRRQGLPVINGMVLVLDVETGRPLTILEGSSLTAIRTGAASGAATDLLARRDATTVAIIGSGVQARTQLEAVCCVRDIRKVWVYSPNREHAADFAIEMAGRGRIPTAVSMTIDAETAVRQADIICTATNSSTPVFDGNAIRPGTHINGVGSFTPQMQEVDATTVRRAWVVVDSREAMLEEAGDLLIPLQRGEIENAHIRAELGEIVNGTQPGRTSDAQITFFKSVGVAVQDAIAARIALDNAKKQNLGIKIRDWI